MIAQRGRFPQGYSTGFAPTYESEGSGSSGRVDTEITISEDSTAPMRKCINLNSDAHNGFVVPMRVLPLSKLSPSERKDLVLRLRAELEKIQILQKRVALHGTNVTLSSSSDILSCSNAQHGPSAANFRKPSALSSGPVKKVNPPGSNGRGWIRGNSGKFESAKRPSVPSISNALLMKQCESLLKKLMSHQHGWIFNTPVDVVKSNIPDYFTVIKQPMDLGTIKSKLASCGYSSPLDFLADVRLTFSNAMTYNPPGNEVHSMAKTLSNFFEARWKVIEKKLSINDSVALPERSCLNEEMEMVKPLPPSKKRKVAPIHHKVMPEPVKQIMTSEEKHNLSQELEALLGDLPDNIIEFLREKSSNGGETLEEEIEIDIDALSDDTLFTLRKLLNDYMQEKRNNQAKAEACEIELQNESGLSNSSMQLHKGNDTVDEDVDIGENEPPVSSHPPLELEKDIEHRSNKCNSPGSSSDSDLGTSGHESDGAKAASPVNLSKENSSPGVDLDGKTSVGDLPDGKQSVGGLDHLEHVSQQKPNSSMSDCQHDGESSPTNRQVSPEKLYRAALLKKRFADTILKAREKTLKQGERGDPEKLRCEREELEMQKTKEKARLQAEARAAEDAQKRAELEAAAKAKQKRELEREAARLALQKMEKTVEINENSRFLEDLEVLKAVLPEQVPSSADETSPDRSIDCLGSFKFGGNHPLEQLGLYMKEDEEEEEVEPHNIPNISNDVEEGEID